MMKTCMFLTAILVVAASAEMHDTTETIVPEDALIQEKIVPASDFTEEVAETLSEVSGPRYMGCYKDKGKRDLPVRKRNGSLASCAAQCKNFKFFGRQWTNECHCGNGFGKYGKTGGCKSCAKTGGNQGGWKNCVYANHKHAKKTRVWIRAKTGRIGNAQTGATEKITVHGSKGRAYFKFRPASKGRTKSQSVAVSRFGHVRHVQMKAGSRDGWYYTKFEVKVGKGGWKKFTPDNRWLDGKKYDKRASYDHKGYSDNITLRAHRKKVNHKERNHKKHKKNKERANKHKKRAKKKRSTTMKAGLTVALKGGRTKRWCADETNRVICNRGHIKQWERFFLGNGGGGKIALRGGRTNRWCADEINRVKCNRGHIKQWEKFTVSNQGHGRVALKGGRGNRWCADDSEVKCNRGHIKQWERFTVSKRVPKAAPQPKPAVHKPLIQPKPKPKKPKIHILVRPKPVIHHIPGPKPKAVKKTAAEIKRDAITAKHAKTEKKWARAERHFRHKNRALAKEERKQARNYQKTLQNDQKKLQKDTLAAIDAMKATNAAEKKKVAESKAFQKKMKALEAKLKKEGKKASKKSKARLTKYKSDMKKLTAEIKEENAVRNKIAQKMAQDNDAYAKEKKKDADNFKKKVNAMRKRNAKREKKFAKKEKKAQLKFRKEFQKNKNKAAFVKAALKREKRHNKKEAAHKMKKIKRRDAALKKAQHKKNERWNKKAAAKKKAMDEHNRKFKEHAAKVAAAADRKAARANEAFAKAKKKAKDSAERQAKADAADAAADERDQKMEDKLDAGDLSLEGDMCGVEADASGVEEIQCRDKKTKKCVRTDSVKGPWPGPLNEITGDADCAYDKRFMGAAADGGLNWAHVAAPLPKEHCPKKNKQCLSAEAKCKKDKDCTKAVEIQGSDHAAMGLIFEGCKAGMTSLDDYMDLRSMCCDPDDIGFSDNIPMFKMQIHQMPVYKNSGFGGRFKANKGAGSVCDMVKALVKGASAGFGL